MKQYSEPTPVFASVIVDYVNDKVNFAYPYEEKKVHKLALNYILPVLILPWFVLTAIILVIVDSSIAWTVALSSIALVIGLSFGMAFQYDRFKTTYPKIMAKIHTILGHKKIIKVTRIDSTVLKIPFFENIMLDYKVTGEFSSFLQRVEVDQSPFKFCEERHKQLVEIRDERIYTWEARFIFSKIPKRGQLVVKFI